MKRLTAIIFILIVSITICKAQKIKITGQITGTEEGDTLRFDKVNTNWDIEPGGFDVIIGKHGKIKYRGKQERSQYYGVSYYPVNGKTIDSDRRWLDIFITDGTIKITGTREYIYYSSLEGGVYGTELNEIRSIDNSLGKVRADYLKFMTAARIRKDTLEMRRYENLYNYYYRDEKVRASNARLKELEVAYNNNNPNEYVASKIAMNLSMPIKEMKENYARFSSEVQNSYYGKCIKETIEALEALAPGQFAPYFKLISTNGNTITLDMFKGKYLLIYHFGMCPGSMQVDKSVANLYNKYSDNLNVVSYTSSLKAIEELHDKMKDGDKVMGMDIKSVLKGMLNHPWEHVVESESTSENIQLNKKYKFIGLPYFIFISPEGKMIERGYHSAFNEATNILKNL